MSLLIAILLFFLSAVNVYFYTVEGLAVNLIAAAFAAFVGGMFFGSGS